MQSVQNALLNAYYEVFTEDGHIKPCGREACMKLINLCTEATDSVSDASSCKFGDPDTGFLNVEQVKELMKEVFPEENFE